MDDISKNIDKCNPDNGHKILIILDDMNTDILSNKKSNPIATE